MLKTLRRSIRYFSKIGGSGYAKLSKEDITNSSIYDVPVLKGTKKNMKGYGELIYSKNDALEKYKPKKWNHQGWRCISEGTGNETLPSIGNFYHYIENDKIKAKNEAVNREYEIGTILDGCIYTRELNYHPCGNQLIYPLNDKPFIILLGRTPKNVHPDDIKLEHLKAFLIEDKGVNIYANTWHQPIFPIAEPIVCFNVQSSTHACIVFDSMTEQNVVLRLKYFN
jgi:ureidoglycolate hydrolase